VRYLLVVRGLPVGYKNKPKEYKKLFTNYTVQFIFSGCSFTNDHKVGGEQP